MLKLTFTQRTKLFELFWVSHLLLIFKIQYIIRSSVHLHVKMSLDLYALHRLLH